MVHVISLSAALFATWLLLSGHYSPLIIGFGAASSIVVVAICQRMDVVDHEGHPIQLGPGAVWYWIWLAYQIAKCNLEVAWLIVSPSRTADPRMVRVHASQRSPVAQVMYANSITLTPGTVTVELQQSELLVHALTPEAAEDLESGAMDRRATAVEI